MFFRRIKTPGLAQHSYVIECGAGKAVVVDPRRDIAEYLKLARDNDLTLTHILETHRQEDFELGSSALAAATGAQIVTGRHALFGRSDIRLADGEKLEVGSTRIIALETPGHTPESVCYAVYRDDAGERCWGVVTGDALFVGGTGRTDLTDPAKTAENAALLYDAIHRKLAPLGDQALVFPAHGSGSACGGKIADRDDSTLGIEKDTNPVFTMTREEFIEHKRRENLPRPPYFDHMEEVNLQGGRTLTPPSRVPILQPAAFKAQSASGIVIDTRTPDAFAGAHIPGSYNVWLKGLSTFGGWIAGEDTKIFLVLASTAEVESAVLALACIGIDSVEGVLAGGISAWREQGNAIASIDTTSAQEAAAWREQGRATILDVRDEREWSDKHIPGAIHVYVGDLEKRLQELPKTKLVVHCSVGNRSGLAASILKRNGMSEIYNMLGGMKAWSALGLPLEKSGEEGP